MEETELTVIKKKRHSLRFRICGLLRGGNNVFDKQLIDWRDKLEDIVNGMTDFTLINVFDTIWWTVSVIYAIMYNPNDLLDRGIKTKLRIFKLIDWLYRGQLSIRLESVASNLYYIQEQIMDAGNKYNLAGNKYNLEYNKNWIITVLKQAVSDIDWICTH